MIYLSPDEARRVVDALIDSALQWRDARELRQQIGRIMLPIMHPAPKKARKVGGHFEADGYVLSEFTCQGKKMVVFELALIPGLVQMVPREHVMFVPDMLEAPA